MAGLHTRYNGGKAYIVDSSTSKATSAVSRISILMPAQAPILTPTPATASDPNPLGRYIDKNL